MCFLKVHVDTMILAIAATEIEMQPFLEKASALSLPCRTLVAGVGPVETTLRLTRFLCESEQTILSAVNFGVGGAYIQPGQNESPALLDICLAEREVAGDFGICLQDKMEYLDASLTGGIVYGADKKIFKKCQTILADLGTAYHTGVFVSVNGVTGTLARGKMLQSLWNGLCENMEGAAVARVCRDFSVPWTELRCISNLVEDRNPSNWRMQDACHKAAHTAVQIISGMTK
jgi:futalosine hydrolase